MSISLLKFLNKWKQQKMEVIVKMKLKRSFIRQIVKTGIQNAPIAQGVIGCSGAERYVCAKAFVTILQGKASVLLQDNDDDGDCYSIHFKGDMDIEKLLGALSLEDYDQCDLDDVFGESAKNLLIPLMETIAKAFGNETELFFHFPEDPGYYPELGGDIENGYITVEMARVYHHEYLSEKVPRSEIERFFFVA